MAQIMVTPAELRRTASGLRDTNNKFKNQVSSLESTEGTLNSQWEGEANTAFHNAFMRDKEYMNRFAAEIEKYCQALETIAAKYDAAEAANRETATSRKY